MRQGGSRAHGLGLLLFALPETLPIPLPSMSTILAIPLIVISGHLILFGESRGIPRKIRDRSVSTSLVQKLEKYVAPVFSKLERLSHPRWEALAKRERLVGVACLILSVILAIANSVRKSSARPLPGHPRLRHDPTRRRRRGPRVTGYSRVPSGNCVRRQRDGRYFSVRAIGVAHAVKDCVHQFVLHRCLHWRVGRLLPLRLRQVARHVLRRPAELSRVGSAIQIPASKPSGVHYFVRNQSPEIWCNGLQDRRLPA